MSTDSDWDWDDDDDDSAHARNSDPETSHDAADSVKHRRASQDAVWWVLALHGEMTDTKLIRTYQLTGSIRQSESGIRTRRKELQRANRVIDTGKRERLPSGRRSIVWQAVR